MVEAMLQRTLTETDWNNQPFIKAYPGLKRRYYDECRVRYRQALDAHQEEGKKSVCRAFTLNISKKSLLNANHLLIGP